MSEAHEKLVSMIGEVAQDLCYLYDRWQDEGDYEDFAEYRKAAQHFIPYPITKMTKRPFAIYFSTVEADYRVQMLTGGAIDVRWMIVRRIDEVSVTDIVKSVS
tara:strand:- start:20 stop:328 length:309 start_codon:yes stop_codon:yes gene_type:complete